MAASIEQLRNVPTRAQTLQWYLDTLATVGFNATSWQSGSPQRTLLLALSRVTTNFAEIGKQIVEFSFNDLARGAALEAYSIARFGNTPKPGTKSRYIVRLTNTGTVPNTVAVGQLILATRQNVQFRNLTGGTVAASGGTLDITVEAVKKGSAGIVGDNTITLLITPLAGVTANNGAGSLVSSGEDPELDSALRLRNSTQWARLSVELVADAYINIALESSANIRRAAVDDNNPRGPGTIDVYIAGASSTVGPAEVAAAQNYFVGRTFQTEAYPADATAYPTNPDPTRVLVIASSGTPISVTGTVYYKSTYIQSAVQVAVESAIQAYIALAPIGGYPYPSPGKLLPKNNLEQAILQVPGVRTVVLSAPADDVPLPGYTVATYALPALTYSPTT